MSSCREAAASDYIDSKGDSQRAVIVLHGYRTE